jgi:hypothetical protein
MSVANVILESHRVRLVGDTLAYLDRQPVQFNRKVRVVRSAALAFTVRGLVALADEVEERSHRWACFESALHCITADLRMAPPQYFPNGAEVTVMGWHGGRAQASRLLVLAKDGAPNVQRIDLKPGVYLAPTLGNQVIPAGMTDDQLVKVACLQQAIAVRHGLNMCVGGDIELTEINAAGISIRKIGEYPDKDVTISRIAKSVHAALAQAAA